MDGFDIVTAVLSFLGGLVSGFTLKVAIDRSKNKRTTTVTQNNNVAGRDIVGGDVKRK